MVTSRRSMRWVMRFCSASVNSLMRTVLESFVSVCSTWSVASDFSRSSLDMMELPNFVGGGWRNSSENEDMKPPNSVESS